jgi:hypothetical protein
VLLFRRSTPGRSLRPSWHGMVNDPSTGAVLFAVTRNARLTYTSVLGRPPTHVRSLFCVPGCVCPIRSKSGRWRDGACTFERKPFTS